MTWINVDTENSSVVSANYIWDSTIFSNNNVAQIFTTPEHSVQINYMEVSLAKNTANASGGEIVGRVYASTGTKGVNAKPTGTYLAESLTSFNSEEFPLEPVIDSEGSFEVLVPSGEISNYVTGDNTRGIVFIFETFNLEADTDYWLVPYQKSQPSHSIGYHITSNSIGDSSVDSGHVTSGREGNWNTPSGTQLTQDLVYKIGYTEVSQTIWIDDTTSWVP